MPERRFYQLGRTPLARALPLLLGRVLGLPARAMVFCGEAARVDDLDAALWLSAEPDWLPHGTARMGEADLQPIWLTAAAGDVAVPPNGAAHLFLLDGVDVAVAPDGAWERVYDLFDGEDEDARSAARERWRGAKAAGWEVTYWREGERGWERGG